MFHSIKILLKKVPFYFGLNDRKLNIIHSTLRNMYSSLNVDLQLFHWKPRPASVVMILKTVCTFPLNVLFTMINGSRNIILLLSTPGVTVLL